MPFARAALLCALSGLSFAVAAENGIVLAPGKTVAVVDAGDPLVRVMVTAPASEPLDLTPLLYSVGAKESVYSIVTRMQVKEAAGLVENADGSLALGAAPPAAAPAIPTITGGTLVVLERGRYAHYKDDASAPATQPAAARPGEQIAGRKDEVPSISRAGASPAPTPPAVASGPIALPTAITLPAGGAISIGSTTGTITFGSFSVGSGSAVNFTQPSASSTTLNGVTTGQNAIFGRVTTMGSTPGGNITVK